jgi:DNA-binding transcriptional regulator YhcF (GntR family)
MLGNLTAKSVLALIADVVNDDGYGWPSVAKIAVKTEVHVRTVMRVLQVFVDIGLIAKVDRGKGKNFGIQVAMDKLGMDLREDFAAAYTAAQRKATTDTKTVETSKSKCRRDSDSSVAETSEYVAETLFSVAETLFSVAETLPPDPHSGGTVSEPLMNLSPLPPQAGADELTPWQLERVATHTGSDRKMWEAFYREQNKKDAEIALEGQAKAKRLEELKQILPDEPSAVKWAMDECGFAGDERRRGVRGAIAAVIAMEHERGRPPWDVAPALVAAWRDYDRIGDLLAVQYGAVKFFRLGVWARRNSWRIDEKKRERLGAQIGSQ